MLGDIFQAQFLHLCPGRNTPWPHPQDTHAGSGLPEPVGKKPCPLTAGELTGKGSWFSIVIPDFSQICHFFPYLEDAMYQASPDTSGYLCKCGFIHTGFIKASFCLTGEQANS